MSSGEKTIEYFYISRTVERPVPVTLTKIKISLRSQPTNKIILRLFTSLLLKGIQCLCQLKDGHMPPPKFDTLTVFRLHASNVIRRFSLSSFSVFSDSQLLFRKERKTKNDLKSSLISNDPSRILIETTDRGGQFSGGFRNFYLLVKNLYVSIFVWYCIYLRQMSHVHTWCRFEYQT